jgi:hypothetical protein
MADLVPLPEKMSPEMLQSFHKATGSRFWNDEVEAFWNWLLTQRFGTAPAPSVEQARKAELPRIPTAEMIEAYRGAMKKFIDGSPPSIRHGMRLNWKTKAILRYQAMYDAWHALAASIDAEFGYLGPERRAHPEATGDRRGKAP